MQQVYELLEEIGNYFNEMIEIERQVCMATLKEAKADNNDNDLLMAQAYSLALNRANTIFNTIIKLKYKQLGEKKDA